VKTKLQLIIIIIIIIIINKSAIEVSFSGGTVREISRILCNYMFHCKTLQVDCKLS